MPMIIPIAAAVGSIAAGVSAVTAVGAGLAATIAGGAMIAGGALTAIGAVTKNQKLMKIGGVVSLAGGIGGLATGAWSGAATSGASSAGNSVAAQEAFRASELGSTAATNAAWETANAVGQNVAPVVEAASQQSPYGLTIPETGNGLRTTGIINPPQAAGTVDVGNVGSVISGGARGGVNPEAVSSWKQGMSGVGKWMSDNKELVNTGSGILGGAMKNASEQDALAEKWKREDEEIARRRAQISASILGLKMPTYQAPKG